MSDEPLILRPGECARGRVTIPPYPSDRTVMLDDDSRVIRDGDELVPVRSWQSALRQLADTLAPGASIEIDPSDPEVSCARIADAVGGRIADLETQRDAKEATIAMAVARLAGRVGGESTHRINFLQRIDELRETEHWANEMSSRFI